MVERRHNAVGKQVTVSEAQVKVFIDGEREALWSVAEGDWWFLVPAAVVGSFVVQSHIGYVVIISVTSVVGVGLGFGRHWRTERPRRTLRWVMLSTATALAFVWWPVVYGRLVSDDGNVSRIAQFFRAEHATA